MDGITQELREIAAHLATMGQPIDPSCVADWPGPGEVLRHADEPMPADEATRYSRQKTEQRIAALMGRRMSRFARVPVERLLEIEWCGRVG